MGKAESRWLSETGLATTGRPSALTRQPAYPSNCTTLSELERTAREGAAMAQPDWTWIVADVDKCSSGDWGTFLEISESRPAGSILARARALIPTEDQAVVLSSFKEATGFAVRAGMKLSMLVCPYASTTAGLSLKVGALGTKYCLSTSEAAKNEVRQRLKAEGLYSKNRQLPCPRLTSILVIAPPSSAALADFEVEAQRLEQIGLCRFQYWPCRFQGDRAVRDLERAIRQHSETEGMPDTLVLIRGGGSPDDFCLLNDYRLARAICDSNVPVMVGIGHQTDKTLLDEVAYRSWGTPSKVIQGITDELLRRAMEAKSIFSETMVEALHQISLHLNELQELEKDWKKTILPSYQTVRRGDAFEEDFARYPVDMNESVTCLTGNLQAIRRGNLELNLLRHKVRQSRIVQSRIDRILSHLQPKTLRPEI